MEPEESPEKLAAIPASSLDAASPAHRTEIARRIAKGTTEERASALERYKNLSLEEKGGVGSALAAQFGLNTREGVESFAKRVIEGKPGAKEDLEMLPQPIREQVKRLTEGDNASAFRLPRTRKVAVDAVAGALMGLMVAVHGMEPGPPSSGRAGIELQKPEPQPILQTARALKLDSPEGVRQFAEALIRNEENPVAVFESLPREIRGQVQMLIRNPLFLSQGQKLKAVAAKISSELTRLEIEAMPEPKLTPGSVAEKAMAFGINLKGVAYYDERLGPLTAENGRVVVKDPLEPDVYYEAVDSAEGLYWERADERNRTRQKIIRKGNEELLFVLGERYSAYRKGLYGKALEKEFAAQAQYKNPEEFRKHLEESIPGEIIQGLKKFPDIASMESLQRELSAFLAQHPDAVLSAAQLQFLANRISEMFGVGTVDVSGMVVGNHRTPISELVEDVYLHTEDLVERNSGRTRVYLWRDAGAFMAVDAVISARNGYPPPKGAFIARGTFGQAGIREAPGAKFDQREAVLFFEGTVKKIIDEAQAAAAKSPTGDRFAAFESALNERIKSLRATDPNFDRACRALLEHLHQAGITNPEAKVVFDGVLVDSSSKTILPFTKALLELEYGDRVKVDIQYFYTAEGFGFLPSLGVSREFIDTVESAGANLSFVHSADNYDNINMHRGARLRDSLIYFMMLRNRALAAGPGEKQ